MQIDFTKEQYENLIKLAMIWESVINWNKVETEIDRNVTNLKGYILKNAKSIWIDTDYNSEEETEKTFDMIDEYLEQEIFNKLIYHLGWRDFLNKFWEAALKKMELEEFMAKEKPFLDFWSNEFEENWLDNLTV